MPKTIYTKYKEYKMSIIAYASESPWYRLFLQEVVDELLSEGSDHRVLDVGTGPGQLPKILVESDPSIHITGVDVSERMLNIARKRIRDPKVDFSLVKVGGSLPFKDEQFDAVTICSVLFLLSDKEISAMLAEALRVLRSGGKILVLTPTGKKSVFKAFSELSIKTLKGFNWTFFIWQTMTATRGRAWFMNNGLKDMIDPQKAQYTPKLVFDKNALLEIITKH